MKVLALLALSSALAFPQSKPAGAGHWEGTIQTPGGDVEIAVDLGQNDKNEWIGDIDIAQRNMKDAPLTSIKVDGAKITFALFSTPGAPAFAGEIAPDGKAMKGDFTAGDTSMPFTLKWVSDPKVALPAKSAPLAKELEGTWEGTIETPNATLRIQVKLANGADGAAGTLVSVDQGGMEIPISDIKGEGDKLSFEVKIVGGNYGGTLNKEASTITGTWTQGGNSLPLNLKKAK